MQLCGRDAHQRAKIFGQQKFGGFAECWFAIAFQGEAVDNGSEISAVQTDSAWDCSNVTFSVFGTIGRNIGDCSG